MAGPGAAAQAGEGWAKGYRELVEGRILQDQEEDLGSRVRWGVVLGGERFNATSFWYWLSVFF